MRLEREKMLQMIKTQQDRLLGWRTSPTLRTRKKRRRPRMILPIGYLSPLPETEGATKAITTHHDKKCVKPPR